MTVIAAIADGSTVWMAADTAEPVNGTWHGAARKIRCIHIPHAGPALLACTGAAGLMATAVAWLDSPDAAGDSTLDPAYHHGEIDTWADHLAINLTRQAASAVPPLTEPDQGGMTALSGTWLLGHAGRVWHLLTHHALPVPDGVTAVGSGADLALGWMLGARDLAHFNGGIPVYPRDLVTGAVTAVCRRSPYCSAPDGALVEVLGTPC